MALQYSYTFGAGPYYFDDDDDIEVDEDGDPGTTDGAPALPAGLKCHSHITSGQLYIGTAPTLAEHVVRKSDGSAIIPTVVTDINAPDLSTHNEQLIIVTGTYEGNTVVTLYAFVAGASDPPAPPYRVAGYVGIYVAIAGHAIAS